MVQPPYRKKEKKKMILVPVLVSIPVAVIKLPGLGV